ncbi:Pre-mRNA splicing factor prp1 [Datura stramonium]|uniref:Glutathione S-transferase n=1 Tax=Datura stramonium TaxID=4076 RepID=A0ABS8V1S1_DATST|nr:Pre-mRNA splicing factor prp1 [Datura stramonium]
MVIVEYIDETFEGPSILPKDLYDRAIARFWAKFLDDKGQAMWKSIFLKGEEQEKAKEEVYEALKVLDNHLKDNNKFLWVTNLDLLILLQNGAALWLGVLGRSI